MRTVLLVEAVMLRWYLIIAYAGAVASFLYAAYHTIRFQNRLWAAYKAGMIAKSVSLRPALFLPGLPGACVPSQKRALVGMGVFAACWAVAVLLQSN